MNIEKKLIQLLEMPFIIIANVRGSDWHNSFEWKKKKVFPWMALRISIDWYNAWQSDNL
jgi:hypothetical protein